MSLFNKEKLFSPQWFRNIALILTGSFIMASGYVFFIDPHGIVPGGVYGIGIIVNQLTQGMFPNGIFGMFTDTFAQYNYGMPIGFTGLILNVPLTFIGIKVLGPKFGIKTVAGFIIISFMIDGLTKWWGLNPLVEDVLLSCVFGGVLIGFGLALIFKTRATTAGSDIIAMIIAKYTKLPIGQLLIIVDSIIVLASLVVSLDWQIPLYSWIVIYITGKVIDTTMAGPKYEKSLFIISDKYEDIREKILFKLQRGATLIPVTGMYENEQRKMIFTNVNRREMAVLQSYIKEIDPNAFMTVFDANQVIGQGFKPIDEVEHD